MSVKDYRAEATNYPYYNVYSATLYQMWAPEELEDEKKRRCESCRKICNDVFMRVFEHQRVKNFCSKECYDNS